MALEDLEAEGVSRISITRSPASTRRWTSARMSAKFFTTGILALRAVLGASPCGVGPVELLRTVVVVSSAPAELPEPSILPPELEPPPVVVSTVVS